MTDLPPEVAAYIEFHKELLSIVASAARDEILAWVVAIAGLSGCLFITRAWAAYSIVSVMLFFFALREAMDKFQASVGG